MGYSLTSKMPLIQRLFWLVLFLFCLLIIKNLVNIFPTSTIQLHRHGLFCVLFNFTRAENIVAVAVPTITLAVHCTLHFAHKLHKQTKRYFSGKALHWDGLISVAVLVRPGEEETALHNLLLLWHCSAPMRARVSLHLVWRKAPFQNQCEFAEFASNLKLPPVLRCAEDAFSEKALPGSLGWPPVRYPINNLRNVARLGAVPQSQVHIVADVENLFSANFTSMVAEFAQRIQQNPDGKELYVFRRFEVENGELMPTNVKELADQIHRGRAFPFHHHFFPIAHRIPDLSDWLNYSLHNDTVRASTIGFMNAAFEPQFLMPANAPLHFEDVPARLYDHQVLLIELCRAGYRLNLLSHVFNVHLGIRKDLSSDENLMKRIAAKQTWKLRKYFKAYLERKYGLDREKICPNFWNRLNLPRRKELSHSLMIQT